MDDREQAVADAKDMATGLTGFAAPYGWKVVGKGVGANKKYAHVKIQREVQTGENSFSVETLQAFYAIDPEVDNDQVTHTNFLGDAAILDIEAGDVRAVVTREHTAWAPPSEPEGPTGTIVSGLISVDGEAVPPTVPPTSQDEGGVPPTETSVPPTGDADAAHLDQHGIEHNDMRTDAAHLTVVDPNEIDDAAHQDASHMVPPIPDVYYGGLEPLTPGAGIEPGVPDPTRGEEPTGRTVVEDFHIVPPANEAVVAEEALQHAAQAKEHGEDVYSQQDLYGAVRQQQVAPYKNWSPVLSDLTSEEILVKLGVNRKSNNRLDIVWMNSLSNTLDRATVDGAAEKHPPHITPVGFDPQTHGEDLRILHFLEVNGGFRSVAIARIRKIG